MDPSEVKRERGGGLARRRPPLGADIAVGHELGVESIGAHVNPCDAARGCSGTNEAVALASSAGLDPDRAVKRARAQRRHSSKDTRRPAGYRGGIDVANRSVVVHQVLDRSGKVAWGAQVGPSPANPEEVVGARPVGIAGGAAVELHRRNGPHPSAVPIQCHCCVGTVRAGGKHQRQIVPSACSPPPHPPHTPAQTQV